VIPFVENCWALLKLAALTATFLPTARVLFRYISRYRHS
jgi:hypothetical protein